MSENLKDTQQRRTVTFDSSINQGNGSYPPRKWMTTRQKSSKSDFPRYKAKSPSRTSKTSQKLALFPEEPTSEVEYVSDGDTPVYTQLKKIPDSEGRLDAVRISKLDLATLPRVTAYCTASSYKFDSLLKFIHARKSINSTNPKRLDECIYTPFQFELQDSPPTSSNQTKLIDYSEAYSDGDVTAPEDDSHLEEPQISGELFFFDYGVVVCWGLSEQDETKVLELLSPFEQNKLDKDDVEVDEFHFHYNTSSQPKIYNDIITLKNPNNYMVKLTISHAMAQSVKMTVFEELVEETINKTKKIPEIMALTGKVQMSRTEITKKIGQLFITRINVNLVSNVLDTPDIFWSEPTLEPLYSAIRGYLEINQRVQLLNQRMSVIGDVLDMLKEHLNSFHSEKLEWIIIVLIALETLIAILQYMAQAIFSSP